MPAIEKVTAARPRTTTNESYFSSILILPIFIFQSSVAESAHACQGQSGGEKRLGLSASSARNGGQSSSPTLSGGRSDEVSRRGRMTAGTGAVVACWMPGGDPTPRSDSPKASHDESPDGAGPSPSAWMGSTGTPTTDSSGLNRNAPGNDGIARSAVRWTARNRTRREVGLICSLTTDAGTFLPRSRIVFTRPAPRP